MQRRPKSSDEQFDRAGAAAQAPTWPLMTQMLGLGLKGSRIAQSTRCSRISPTMTFATRFSMINASEEKRDFFVSFSKADNTCATWIASALEEAGYSVFF